MLALSEARVAACSTHVHRWRAHGSVPSRWQKGARQGEAQLWRGRGGERRAPAVDPPGACGNPGG
eukprot:10561483-Alexandrium_andersonii.AAC.1